MEFWFYYNGRALSDVRVAITVPRNAFDILYKTESIGLLFEIEDSPMETYIFCVKESVMYYCGDDSCQKIPVNITGLNIYFVLLWLIKQLGKQYDYLGAYTPLVTENAFHPGKLAMTAVSQVCNVDEPWTYDIYQTLKWVVDSS